MRKKDVPHPVETGIEIPVTTLENKIIPPATETTKEVPMSSELSKVVPSLKKTENCIRFGEELVEIKPTKLKYFRNKAASIYSILKVVPLNEFLAYDKGVFDKERDSDQILLDFLVAVFDDEEFVRAHYDDLSADDIEQILEIFGRINHITEKEEAARKNKEAQAKH